MKINIAQIIEGWRNKLIPPEHIKDLIKKVREERTEICNGCEFLSTNRLNYKTIRFDVHCTLCGCPISAKTSCLSCWCDIHKWDAVITEEEEEEINNDEQIDS
jgi:hypothetical protein